MQPMVIKLIASALILVGMAGCGGGGGGDGGDGRPSSKLFVVDSGNQAIGSMINPNPSPGTLAVDRIISGANTGLGTPGIGTPSVSTLPSLALDAAGDRIYVATQLSVLQWENAGFASGNTPRTRAFTSL